LRDVGCLEEFTDFILDGTHDSPERVEHGVPVLSAQNISAGKLNWQTDRFTTNEAYQAFARRLAIASGDLLLTIVGSIGRAAIADDVHPLVFQRSVAVIRPRNDTLDSRFLFHVTQSVAFQNQLKRATNQSSQAGVYLGKLKKIAIPRFPLEEQKRIAAILDAADALREKRLASISELDVLTKVLFLHQFGSPETNPNGWPQRTIADVGSVITGNTPARADSALFGDEIEWIKSDNINAPDYYITRADEGLSRAGMEVSRIAPAHSILVTCIRVALVTQP
jgi:type I restriction enzyme S subunit